MRIFVLLILLLSVFGVLLLSGCDDGMKMMKPVMEEDKPPTPLEQAQSIMKAVNERRLEICQEAEINNPDFFTFSENVNKAFSEILALEIGQAFSEIRAPETDFPVLFQIWLLAFFSRELGEEIDIDSLQQLVIGAEKPDSEAINKYLIFVNISQQKAVGGDYKSYLGSITAHDPILTEYLRLYFEYPEEDEHEILERFTKSITQGDVDIIYPEGFTEELLNLEDVEIVTRVVQVPVPEEVEMIQVPVPEEAEEE